MQEAAAPDISIIGAALIMQVALLAMLTVTAAILESGHWKAANALGYRWHPQAFAIWTIVLLFIFSICPLLLSESFDQVWTTMFPSIPRIVMTHSSAMSCMFFADTGAMALLIGQTGGSRESPFAQSLGVFPALAIFLGEPFSWVCIYSLVIFAVLWVTYRSGPSVGERRHFSLTNAQRNATIFVQGASIGLTTLLGFVTQA